jgi:hypothetical protein
VKWQTDGTGEGVRAAVLKVAEWTEAENMVEAALKEPAWREAETTVGGVLKTSTRPTLNLILLLLHIYTYTPRVCVRHVHLPWKSSRAPISIECMF